ncbi:MAG: fructose-bisphosphatase class III [Phycisphaerales bacterium]
MPLPLSPEQRSTLAALSRQYRTIGSAVAELAGLNARLTLPKGIVHVISDVHGEFAKLRHVISNASGALRPLVTSLLGGALSEQEQTRLLSVIYYPREVISRVRPGFGGADQRAAWVLRTLRLQFEIVRELSRSYRWDDVQRLIPADFRELFEELINETGIQHEPGADAARAQRLRYIETMIAAMARHGRDLAAVRAASRLIRNLSAAETIVAGDLGDRGPRIDRVIDVLMRQPNVSILWGNHDAIWMGACLGNDACIATLLRFSCRYRRGAQLEEGYGIALTPLDKLVREKYADDPAERFKPKGTGLRDERQVARMEKAISVIQFKVEGAMFRRRPDWGLEHRALLHRIDPKRGTIKLGEHEYRLLDTHFPTIDWSDPYALSPEERECMDRLRDSFVSSSRFWEHMNWVVRHGGMWTTRDDALIYHACVPVDERGEALSLRVDGRDVRGRELFDALDSVVRRAFRKGAESSDDDADWLYYLWGGPRSPLFGKDKLATFETYFLAEKETHKEHKNPYFELMHEADFCRRMGEMFGCPNAGRDVLIVNGHVPVKVEKGEQPVKRGGNAVTIDGAFSEAYGDRGYTLVLRPEGISLAEHSAFTSVAAVIDSGADIVPRVTTIRSYAKARTVADTEQGEVTRRTIADLELLIRAYEEGELIEGE